MIWVLALLSAILLPPAITLVLMGLILILFMLEVPVGSQRGDGGGASVGAPSEGST